jgi:hypothetical protein
MKYLSIRDEFHTFAWSLGMGQGGRGSFLGADDEKPCQGRFLTGLMEVGMKGKGGNLHSA